MRIRTIAFATALLLASAPVHAEIHKCRQGERVVYQEAPCPSGSQSLTPPAAVSQPSAFEVEAARARARKDIAAAEALRKREELEAKALERKRAAAHKQDVDCTRLLERIEAAQAKEKLSKSQKSTLRSNEHKYRKVCGPL